jgi:hypothetical protein
MPKWTQTLQPVQECRWSVPACRRNPLADDDNEFESYWVCERTGVSVPVTPDDCARCEHWSPDSERAVGVRVSRR